jgi:hypothetical protein
MVKMPPTTRQASHKVLRAKGGEGGRLLGIEWKTLQPFATRPIHFAVERGDVLSPVAHLAG